MAKKLNAREKRILLLGAASAVVILVLTYGSSGYDRWSEARAALASAKRRIADVETDKSRQAALAAMVPVCETPEVEDKQKFLFRDRLHEQLKKAGINTEPLQFLPVRKPKAASTMMRINPQKSWVAMPASAAARYCSEARKRAPQAAA